MAPAASRQAGSAVVGAVSAGGRQPPLQRPAAPGSSVTLRYLGPATVNVRGAATGRAYAFSAADPLRAVDPRDAAILLGTSYFRQA